MPRKAIQINISDRVADLLKTSLNKRQLEGHYKRRMQIIYQSSLGIDNQDIAKDIGCSVTTVRKWRKRWGAFEEVILKLEEGLDNKKANKIDLLRKIKEILSDAYRSGSPSGISDSDKMRLQALACESPKDHGLPFTVWTHQELAKQAGKMGIQISASYFGILLKKLFAPAQI